VLTRFDTLAFGEGVSDIAALDLLLKRGARVRGVRYLHAKVYLFGQRRVIITSANLTKAALHSNHEFGLVADDPEVVNRSGDYFDHLWRKAGRNLTARRIEEWRKKVQKYRLRGAPAHPGGLGDEGQDVGLPAISGGVADSDQVQFRSFIKFFGDAGNRAEHTLTVLDEVKRAGCHWACTYPEGKRPRQVEDGSIMFMARLVQHPTDIMIFGRAVGFRHRPGVDDASPHEIDQRKWKSHWPHYVRVEGAQFLAGNVGGGVSLNGMMKALNSDAFASTQRNAKKGRGNTNPRLAYMSSAQVELSPKGYRWLTARLNEAFTRDGQLSNADLRRLDWPGHTVAEARKARMDGAAEEA
jgi:hypothetical protein